MPLELEASANYCHWVYVKKPLSHLKKIGKVLHGSIYFCNFAT